MKDYFKTFLAFVMFFAFIAHSAGIDIRKAGGGAAAAQTATGWTSDGTTIQTSGAPTTLSLGANGTSLFITQASPGILRYPSTPQKYLNLQAASGMDFQVQSGERVRVVGGGVTSDEGVSVGLSLTLVDYTDDSATTGNRTVNKNRGKSAFAGAASTITITNSFVTTASNVHCGLETADTTCKSVVCVPGAGSFVATVNAACTATTKLGWTVIK